MSKMTVFIHTNSQQMVGALVGAYALRKLSNNCDKFDVKILNLNDFPHLTSREGQTYLRKKRIVTWRNRDLQSFSPLRFLPPQLMGYEGRAVLMDPDIFARADIYELLTRDMRGKAIICRQGYPENPTDLNFNTSVMLLDCSRLRHWNWNQQIDDMFAEKLDYGDWIFLRNEDKSTIGELEPEWNDWDRLTESTKLLHNTERSTQPWKTGLPVDYNLNYQPSANQGRWKSMVQATKKLILRTDVAHERYLPHPDQQQERLFFSLLKECLQTGVVDEEFLRQEMRQQHVRADALKLLRAAG